EESIVIVSNGFVLDLSHGVPLSCVCGRDRLRTHANAEAEDSGRNPQECQRATTRSQRVLWDGSIRWSTAHRDVLILENTYQPCNFEAQRSASAAARSLRRRLDAER